MGNNMKSSIFVSVPIKRVFRHFNQKDIKFIQHIAVLRLKFDLSLIQSKKHVLVKL